MTGATLLICNDKGRVGLLARAQASLPLGDVIVQVKDLVGCRRAFRTTVLSTRAELVAEEPALVMRGGLTSLVAYYRVPATDVDAIEEHFDRGRLSHSYEIKLRVVCRGERSPLPFPALV